MKTAVRELVSAGRAATRARDPENPDQGSTYRQQSSEKFEDEFSRTSASARHMRMHGDVEQSQ